MVTVYRVELSFSVLNEEGKRFHSSTNIGPYVRRQYANGIGGFESLYLCTPYNLQPEPEEDGMEFIQGWHSGFVDLPQLFRWFRDDLARLEWSGFIIAEYQLPNEQCISHGYSQIQFELENAVLVGFYPVRQKYCDYTDNLYSNVA